MKKLTLIICFLLFICSINIHADICMEGYENSSGDCVVFDRVTAPRPEGMSTTGLAAFGSNPEEYSLQLTYLTSGGLDLAGIYYKPATLNATTDYPYNSSSTDEPNFWCNDENPNSLSSGPSTDYGWSYGYQGYGRSGYCKVLALLQGSNGGILDNSNYGYTWIDSFAKLAADKQTPAVSNVTFGMAQSKILYSKDGVSLTAVQNMFSEIAASGVSIIRIPMDQVPLSATDTTQTEFEELMDVLQKADDAGLQVVLAVNIFSNVEISTSTVGACSWNPMKVTDWYNNGASYSATSHTFQEHMGFALDRFVSEGFTHIVAIELGNELDTVCYNADIPYDGSTEPSMTGSAFSDSAEAYGHLLAATHSAINNSYSSGKPDLITYGMTLSYRAWHLACDTSYPGGPSSAPGWCSSPVQLKAWDGVAYLAGALESLGSPNYGSDIINGIGYHFYINDLSESVTDKLTNVLYPMLDPIYDSGNGYPYFPDGHVDHLHNKPVWLTEWGVLKKGPLPGPSPFYDKSLRYRSMAEFMESINTDTGASKIGHAFLYSFYSTDNYQVGELNLSTGKATFVMPEARVIKLYANDWSSVACGDAGTGNGGWQDPCDSDSDGLTDNFEIQYSGTGATGLDPLTQDTDDDGILDDGEDFDSDGLTNLREQLAGANPNDSDTDDDGDADGSDNCVLVANPDQIDSAISGKEPDGYGNACDGDLDNDGDVDIDDLRLLVSQGFASWINIAVDDMPATSVPRISEEVSEINQQQWYQWQKNGTTYVPGPSGLSCAGSIPCPAQ